MTKFAQNPAECTWEGDGSRVREGESRAPRRDKNTKGRPRGAPLKLKNGRFKPSEEEVLVLEAHAESLLESKPI